MFLHWGVLFLPQMREGEKVSLPPYHNISDKLQNHNISWTYQRAFDAEQLSSLKSRKYRLLQRDGTQTLSHCAKAESQEDTPGTMQVDKIYMDKFCNGLLKAKCKTITATDTRGVHSYLQSLFHRPLEQKSLGCRVEDRLSFTGIDLEEESDCGSQKDQLPH